MGPSTEDIEAKLAAFVDGELDAAGRDDIEKHLLANPQHRKLLDDLMRGRALLRDLPREGAPPEILDSIQGHLERRLLLDEESAAVAGRRGSGGLRRFMAVAAVLMLTATLGLVIYSVLPSGKTGGDLAAALERSESAASTDAMPAPTETRVARSDARPSATDADVRDRAIAAATDAIRGAAGGTAGGEFARMAEPDVAHPAVPDAALAMGGGAVDEVAPVIVLATDDRAATERDLSAVLLDNRVVYEQVALPALGARRFADAGAREEAGESIFVAKKITRAQYQAIEQALQSPARARKQAVAQATQQQYQSFRQGYGVAKDELGATDAAKSGIGGVLAKEDAATSAEGQAAQQMGAAARPNGGNITGVAMDSAKSAASQPADVIASGDKLKVEFPGMMQSNVGGPQTVEVGADGSIQIAPLEPIAVAGLTTDQVQQKLAGLFGEGKVSPSGPIVVERELSENEALGKEAEPLTDVVIVVRSSNFEEAAPATQPAGEMGLPSAAPATAPATPATSSTAPSSYAPSTQPGN